ncbi:MAG: hypothetical protein V4739_16725 [Pseudomonadota bacterium]
MDKKVKSRSIPLQDIRYFECEGLVDDGSNHEYTGKLFHVPKQAWARGNRLATLCQRANVSIAKKSLYLCFTPALSDGVVCPTEFRGEVWQRYVMYGLPLSFNQCNEETRVRRVWSATLESLRTIAPFEQIEAIEKEANIVELGGENLQFSLTSAKTKKYLAELSYTIPTWPGLACLLLTLTDGSSLIRHTCVLFESKVSTECSFLGGKVKIVDGNVIVRPHVSSWGTYFAKRNNVSSFVIDIQSLLQGDASIVKNPYETFDT